MASTLLAILFLLPTLPLWIFVLIIARDQHRSDAAGNAIARAYAAIATILLWILLTLLLIVSASHGEMPPWAQLIALLLLPASCIATLMTLDTMAKESKLKWPILLPAAAPPLILFYAAWSFFPAIHPATGTLAPTLITWGTLFALLAVLPLARAHRARLAPTPEQIAQLQAAQQESYRQQIADSFHQLTPDSPFADWWQYANGDTQFRHEARQKLPLVKSRQSDIPPMLPTTTRELFFLLPHLNLHITPELQSAVRTFLTYHTNSLMPYDPAGTNTTKIVTDWYQDLFPTLHWFTTNGGSCNTELNALATAVSQYPDTQDRQNFLTTLATFHTPPQ